MLTTAPHLYIRRPSPTTAEFTVTTCPPLNLPLRFLLLTLHLLRLALLSAAVLTLYSRFFDPTIAATPPSTTPNNPFNTNSNTTPTAPPHELLLPLLLARDIPAFLATLLQTALLSGPGLALTRTLAPVPDHAAGALALAAVYLAVCARLHTTESVLVLRGLGIQTCSSASSAGLGSASTAGYTSKWGWGSRYGGGGGSGSGGYGSGGVLGWGWGWGTQTRFIPTEKIRDVLINEAFRGFEVRYYLIVVVEGEEDVVVLFPGLLPRRRIVEAVWRGVRGCLFEGDEGGGKG